MTKDELTEMLGGPHFLSKAALVARIEELERALGEASKDAKRYKWLRHADFGWADQYAGDLPEGEEFDALVDQTMEYITK